MERLLWCCDGAHAGVDNMERDRALWQKFEADPSGGVRLRIYGWSPPALSLGFHQAEATVDRAELERRGFDLVRRPTGGAAVLHVDEITYCVSAPLGVGGMGRGVLEIHRVIAEALASSFRSLGVDVRFGGDGVPREFACFAGAGGHEMTLGGRKLVGSALRRGRRAFLQHGSVLRSEEHLDLCGFMAGVSGDEREVARADLASRTCVLADLDEVAFGEGLARELAAACGIPSWRVNDFEELLGS